MACSTSTQVLVYTTPRRVASGSTTVVLELDTTPWRVASGTSTQLLVPATPRRVAPVTTSGSSGETCNLRPRRPPTHQTNTAVA